MCATLAGAPQAAHAAAPLQAGCMIQAGNSGIKRVLHLTFDNAHLRRDNPNVPSDLEQMPNLLNFLLQNGIVIGNHHTPLISHTAHDITTALSGVYGSRSGIPVANSYGFFKPDGSVGFSSSFLYWTAPSGGSATAGDGKPNFINELGKNAPAPWVPYTTAGCDFGGYSTANIEFEKIPQDVDTVFGTSSPESTEAHSNATLASADFLGIVIHCAKNSPLCNNSNARPDLLPDEPGGYTGYSALYGNQKVQPVISPSGPVLDIDGRPITDGNGNPGFPGFSPTATQSLGYVATMLEAGVPVVYFYMADVHDSTNGSGAYGPGETGYVQALKTYDAAWGKFFARLAADGITAANTLFVITADENDHVAGGPPTPANCDGINVPCTYAKLGEVDTYIDRLLLTQRGNSTAFSVHSDDAPTFYINGNPLPTDPLTRTMEADVDALMITSPITGNLDKLSVFLADQAEMNLLHMVTSAADRTPTFTMFGNPDYFNQVASGTQGHGTTCSNAPACVFESRAFAWNHGDVQQEITRTWFSMVGPGVKNLGRFDSVFSDHTDLRPTILALLGLTDDYVVDGRVLAEVLDPAHVPPTVVTPQFLELADVYKRINAPVGPLGLASLKYANASITSGDPAAYGNYLTSIAGITTTRNNLTGQMIGLLNNAAFAHQDINPEQASSFIAQGNQLLAQVQALAGPAHLSTHDFNGDTFSDVLWRDTAGSVAVWLMNGSQILAPGWIGPVPNTWSLLGQRDFNGDGKADLLRRDTSGNTAIWFLNGTQVVSSQGVGNIPTTWTIIATADFNGDGMGDILWQDGSGNLSVWLMNGASVMSAAAIGNVPTSAASVVGTGDFNGDGKSDLLWRDTAGDASIVDERNAGVGNSIDRQRAHHLVGGRDR
jgi:FG-GAP-like repeat